jgi:ribonucleotide reductase alpha subunit
VNKHLVNELLNLGLWNEELKRKLIMENGSIQNIPEIPVQIKEVYKTVWEMSQKRILQMAANRSVFIDQSQSLNLFIDNATKPKLLAAHLFGWKLGLKTGMYYLRTRSAVDAIKGLGIDTAAAKPTETQLPSVVYQTTQKSIISEETPEVVMTNERPTDSPFECEGCGS